MNLGKDGYLLVCAAFSLLLIFIIEAKGCNNNNDCYVSARTMASVEALKICAEQDRWSGK